MSKRYEEGHQCDRYLIPFNTDEIAHEYYDVVIIGSGIAGVYTALQIDSRIKVAIITKKPLISAIPYLRRADCGFS